MITLTSRDIDQYVYCNCFAHQIATSQVLCFKSVRFFTLPKIQYKNLSNLRPKRAIKVQ